MKNLKRNITKLKTINNIVEEVSDQFIVEIQEKLNHRPRKILGYKTPHEVFFAKIAQWIDNSKLHYKNNCVELDC